LEGLGQESGSDARLNTEPTVTSVREGGREGGREGRMDGWCGDMKHFFIAMQLLSKSQ